MLQIKNISKSYKEKKVLDDISFDIGTGKVCALLGLNGAGKTTLMKILCSLAYADSGEILLNGQSLFKNFAIKENIGYMIESPAFYNELTGKENLFALSFLYDNIPKKRIDEVLAFAGISSHANIKVKSYSLGMKQRLYFAYAILNKPKLLILDEPFNSIDPISISLFKILILKLAKEGCTVLISGHIISEIQTISDSAVIIDKRNIVYYEDDLKGKDLTSIFLSIVSASGDAQ